MIFKALIVTLLGASTVQAAAPPVSETQYFSDLGRNLSNNGLSLFSNALAVANQTVEGSAVLRGLYADAEYTIYAPVDAAWRRSSLTNPPPGAELVDLLRYHIVKATINSTTDVAPARRHTVALTILRNPSILLPGNQTQVIVLETAPNATFANPETPILIRGDNWNATSQGSQFTYQNLHIQPIDKILAVPSSPLDTLNRSGLALDAGLGARGFVNVVRDIGISSEIESCQGCTFFVPVDPAFGAVDSEVRALGGQKAAVMIKNHMLNGTVSYSPQMASGSIFITAAGKGLGYSSNSTGGYIFLGNHTARILRSDLPVANGVVHLVDTVLIDVEKDEAAAESAASAASAAAQTRTGDPTGTIGSSATNPPGSSPEGRGERRAILSLTLLTLFVICSSLF